MADASTGVDGPSGTLPAGSTFGRVWRVDGEALFATLTVVVVVVEALALAALIWALLFSRVATPPGSWMLADVLVAAVSTTAVLLAVVTVAATLLRSVSARREEAQADETAAWTDTWRRVVAGSIPCPVGPIDDGAMRALLEIREAATGVAEERAGSVIRAAGGDRILLGRLEAIVAGCRYGWPRRLVRSLRSHRRSPPLGATLDTLDDLAMARLGEAVPLLLALVTSGRGAIRNKALRAAARSIAGIGSDRARAAGALALLDGLPRRELSRGALDETLLLLDQAAVPVVRSVLTAHAGPAVRGRGPPGKDDTFEVSLVAACLDSVARLHLQEVGELIAPQLAADRPLEIRAAGLRALAGEPALPANAALPLRRALSDPQDVVRTQAARAARLLPGSDASRALVALLADPSWWVRLAAGETLATLGPPGTAALTDAARHHSDRFARQMAAQVLRNQAVVGGSDTDGGSHASTQDNGDHGASERTPA